MSHTLLSVAEIRHIEHAALLRMPPHRLMQDAGIATAQSAMRQLPDRNASVLVIAGPGNNGGDACEAAMQLQQHGYAVTLIVDLNRLQTITDTTHPGQRVLTSGLTLVDLSSALAQFETTWSFIIDGLFGIGLQRPITGHYALIIGAMNRQSCPILAIDLPSGLDADTGHVIGGASGLAVRASQTITFISDKPGLHTCDGPDYCGKVIVESLGLEEDIPAAGAATLTATTHFVSALKPRARNSHKGCFGDLMIVGGAQGMVGATILAARAGLHAGAGRIFAGFIGPAPAFDVNFPELMCRQGDALTFKQAAVVAGPGLGDGHEAAQLLTRILRTAKALVLDADALNLIAKDALLQNLLRQRAPNTTIITPHPLEAARLLHCTVGQVQSDRMRAAKMLHHRFNAIAILKGAGTVIATTAEHVHINPTGNPALATGGTGDVLAGVCGAFLAQGIPAEITALAATWVHGHAADQLVANGVGPIGLSPSEIIPAIRKVINALTP
jgi:hydroxyethylthiazole kinase-like uncharacterized protein yjeF